MMSINQINLFPNVLCYLKFLFNSQAKIAVMKMLDDLGRQSSIAQNLNNVITTGEKMKNSTDVIIYVLIDPNSNGYVLLIDIGSSYNAHYQFHLLMTSVSLNFRWALATCCAAIKKANIVYY